MPPSLKHTRRIFDQSNVWFHHGSKSAKTRTRICRSSNSTESFSLIVLRRRAYHSLRLLSMPVVVTAKYQLAIEQTEAHFLLSSTPSLVTEVLWLNFAGFSNMTIFTPSQIPMPIVKGTNASGYKGTDATSTRNRATIPCAMERNAPR
jgi:hypothetical protein